MGLKIRLESLWGLVSVKAGWPFYFTPPFLYCFLHKKVIPWHYADKTDSKARIKRVFLYLMDLYNDLKDQLIRHEGLKLMPYRCTANKYTIGVGRNLEDNGISEQEAMMLLDADIKNCEAELDRVMPWWKEQPSAVQQVLLNMLFNLGAPTLMQFRKFQTFLQTKEYKHAAEEMLNSKWAEQVGSRAIELSEMVRSADDS